jgi:YVTN family beta-propeller protein
MSFTLDTLNNKLYGIGNTFAYQNIYAFDTSNNSVKPILNLTSALSSMVYDSWTGNFYVAIYGPYNSILVFNSSTYVMVRNISISAVPSELVFDPDNGEIYAASYRSNVIFVINATTNIVTGEIKTSLSPSQFAYDPGNKNMYVTTVSRNSSASELDVIDTISNSIVATLEIPTNYATFLTYDDANRDVYVGSQLSNNITIISTTSNQIVKSVLVPYHASAIAYNPTDLFVYVATNETGGAISKIDSGTNAILNPSSGLGLLIPGAFTYDKSNGVLYLTWPEKNVVLAISANPRSLSCLSFNGQPTYFLSVSNPYLNSSANNHKFTVSCKLTPSQNVSVYYNGTTSYLTKFEANPQWEKLSNGSWIPTISSNSTTKQLWQVSQNSLNVTMPQVEISANQTGSFMFDLDVGNLTGGYYGLELNVYLEFSSYPATAVQTVYIGYIPIDVNG